MSGVCPHMTRSPRSLPDCSRGWAGGPVWLPWLSTLSSRQLRVFLRPELSKCLLNESITRGAMAEGLINATVSATSPVSSHSVVHNALCF